MENNQESFETGISLDILEQHQAQEQARLLKRFRELREWQQHQQQQLMRQQQQQLLSLQNDHNKVQTLLATQRGPESGFQGMIHSGSPVLTPPAKNAVHSKPNQSRQRTQPVESGISLDSGLVMSMQDTLKSQNSLPKPVMYSDPNQFSEQVEEDKYTNSELFSNVDSHDDDRVLVDENHGQSSYPDWMSDTSENFMPPKLPPPRPTKSQLINSSRDQLAGLEELLNTAPPALLQQVLSLLPGHPSTTAKTPGAHEVEQSASPTLPVSVPRPQNFDADMRNSPIDMVESWHARRVERSLERERVEETVFDDSHQKTQLDVSDSIFSNKYKDDEHINSDGVDDDSQDSDDGQRNLSPKSQVQEEDRPIQGTHGMKSFHQLLEEKLRSEGKVASVENGDEEERNDLSKPKSFLRKGEGIARFNSAPVKRPKPKIVNRDRNRPPPAPSRMERDSSGEKNVSQNLKRIQTAGAREKEGPGQGRDSLGKQFPPLPKKAQNPNVQRQESDASVKSSSHLSIIHSAAQRRKEMQKVRGKEETTPSYDIRGQMEVNENRVRVTQSPLVDGVSNATDENDLTELDSLAEFEILEDAADNMSFCSNSSLVKKLVCFDQQSHKEAVKKLKTLNEARNTSKDKAPNVSVNSSVANETTLKTVKPSTIVSENRSNNNSNVVNDSHVPMPDLTAYNFYSKGSSDVNIDANNVNKLAVDNLENSESFIQNFGGFAAVNSVAPEGLSSPISPSNIPRAVFIGDEETPVTPPQPSTKTMTRKIASSSSKFTEANDTLSLLKSLSQKAGLLTSGMEGRRAERKPGSNQCYWPNGDDANVKSTDNVNSTALGITQSSDFVNQLKTTSLGDVPQSASETFFNINYTDISHAPGISSTLFQPSEDISHYFSLFKGNELPQTLNHRNLSSVQEEDSTVEEDGDDDDSETCESSDDESRDFKKRESHATTDAKSELLVVNPVESSKNRVVKNEFDDDEEWSEEEEQDVQQNNLHDKYEISTRATNTADKPPVSEALASSPPTSGLVSKLFPKLKPQLPPPQVKQGSQLDQGTSGQENVVDGVQSRVLRDKFKELDNEIERFRSENARLNKLRREREEGLEKLKHEIKTFQKEKEEELKRFESFKMQEMKKFKREKKQFDNYQKKMRSMPARKEKEEIDALKGQLEELQDELKRKETRWTSSTARLKNRLAELETENGELREEIRIMEKKRLEWMVQPKISKASSQNSLKASSEDGIRLSNEATVYPTSDVREGMNKSSGNVSKNTVSAVPIITSASHVAITRAPTNRQTQSESNKNKSQINGVITSKGTMGDGATVQNNFIPVMAENTLLKQQGVTPEVSSFSVKVPTVPISSNVHNHSMESASNLGQSGTKSAALAAMEKAVIDKGDLQNCKENRHKDGKVEKIFETGAKEIHFPNGTIKEVSCDGQTIVCRLANGDVRQIFPDHRVVYIFAEAQIMQTSFPDGLEMFHFKNGQVEKRYPDGTVEITFPSKDIKYLFPDGGQEVILIDGTVMQYNSKGERTVEYPSGDREVHTAEYQRREFPDGIVKTIYSDGRHETRFPNGRVRLRDKAGNIIMDQICPS